MASAIKPIKTRSSSLTGKSKVISTKPFPAVRPSGGNHMFGKQTVKPAKKC